MYQPWMRKPKLIFSDIPCRSIVRMAERTKPNTRSQERLRKGVKVTTALSVVMRNTTPEVSARLLRSCDIGDGLSREISKWINTESQDLPDRVMVGDFVLYQILPYNPEIVYRIPQHQRTPALANETMRLLVHGYPGNGWWEADAGTIDEMMRYFINARVLTREIVMEMCQLREDLDIDLYMAMIDFQ